MLTDPTYLRYIFDGLDSQSIQKENISALPAGLIGIYEEALPPEHNVQDREKILSFFSTWALLKKEVSASLISKILSWHEQDVIDCLSIYTKWFNSPTSGTYLLYHERLRVFLLEKVSSQQLHLTNQKIISLCQTALEQRKGDEWELYALEHLPSHLLIPAMQQEQGGAEYRKLVNDKGFWNRQVEINKGYDWTKKMLNQSMGWAAKQSKDELIECALNKIDLHYMEQNDAPRIVELVAQNDIDIALQRIEAFGGNDMEGLQKKFTLYMLCLMELTLLDSKDKPFRKSAIAKILNHLDENIPIDHSLLNWNDFFPSYLMFQMSCEWAEMGLDYVGVYKRTEKWDSNWIVEIKSFSDLQFEVINMSVRVMSSDLNNYKCQGLKCISINLAKNGKFREALECANEINDLSNKCIAFVGISAELANYKLLDESAFAIKNALQCASEIIVDDNKYSAFVVISAELARQEKIQEALECANGVASDRFYFTKVLVAIYREISQNGQADEYPYLIQEALESAYEISVDEFKGQALNYVSIELSRLGRKNESELIMKEALKCVRDLNDNWLKSQVLKNISVELREHGQGVESAKIISEALEIALGIGNDWKKSYSLRDISNELVKQGNMPEALKYTNSITIEVDKIEALIEIISELAKQGKDIESASLIKESIKYSNALSEKNKSLVLGAISAKLVNQGKIKEAIVCSFGISYERIERLNYLSYELRKRGEISESVFVIQQALECIRKMSDFTDKSYALECISYRVAELGKDDEFVYILKEAIESAYQIGNNQDKNIAIKGISNAFAKQGKIKEAIKYADGINGDWEKCSALVGIVTEIAKKGNIQLSLSTAYNIDHEKYKFSALINISTEFAKQGNFNKALEIVSGINNNWNKSGALIIIFIELSKHGKLVESASVLKELFKCARGFSDNYKKSAVLTAISKQLAKQGKLDESLSVLQDSIECATGINDNEDKGRALELISLELAKHGKYEESLECALGISNHGDKNRALKAISTEQAKQGKLEEALECARGISDKGPKSEALAAISTKLAIFGNWKFAEKSGLEIPQIAERYKCWKGVAKSIKDKDGWQIALQKCKMFQNNEARLFYLKGWAESFNINDFDSSCLEDSLPYFIGDSGSIEKLLQVYSLNELFFGNPSQEKINRLNKTLNLQWALDIIAQFAKE